MAVTRDRILIEKANIPYRFSIALPRELFELEIRYNETEDLFTVALYKDSTLICIEPMLYGRRLFGQLYQPQQYPAISIIPNDSSGEESRVTWDNFGDTVFLEIFNQAGDE